MKIKKNSLELYLDIGIETSKTEIPLDHYYKKKIFVKDAAGIEEECSNNSTIYGFFSNLKYFSGTDLSEKDVCVDPGNKISVKIRGYTLKDATITNKNFKLNDEIIKKLTAF